MKTDGCPEPIYTGVDTTSVDFDSQIKLEFHGAAVTSDAGLPVIAPAWTARAVLGMTGSIPGRPAVGNMSDVPFLPPLFPTPARGRRRSARLPGVAGNQAMASSGWCFSFGTGFVSWPGSR